MMYNIGLKLGPNILLFITHYIKIKILWNYINFHTYLFKIIYIYIPMVMCIAIIFNELCF
jgi:hypothetical protein